MHHARDQEDRREREPQAAVFQEAPRLGSCSTGSEDGHLCGKEPVTSPVAAAASSSASSAVDRKRTSGWRSEHPAQGPLQLVVRRARDRRGAHEAPRWVSSRTGRPRRRFAATACQDLFRPMAADRFEIVVAHQLHQSAGGALSICG